MPDRRDLTVPINLLNKPPKQVKSMSVTARAVLAGCIVATISVVVTALIAIPLAIQATEKAAKEALVTQANAVAITLRARALRPNSPDEQRILEQLRKQGIEPFFIADGKSDPAGVPERMVEQISSGKPVSTRATLIDGKLYMIEGRPIGDTGTGFILAKPARTGIGAQVVAWVWCPLLAGLIAGVLAGIILGRRLARPIRNAAIAAARLSSGDRGVRLAVEPPADVERLALAINDLAEALATSEGRQREFLLSISHELRTPLTTIRGYAEALCDGVVDSAAASSVGRTVLTEAERLDRLVADLLSLARLEAADFTIEPTTVDLPELARSAQNAFAQRCSRHGVEIRTELPAYSVNVYADPVRLRQIVDGLVENALRVVPPGQAIVLAVSSAGREALIQVRDGGPGLTDDDLQVAFEKGALHAKYQGIRKVGSGLGLALAAGLARRLGGRLEAGHAPEGGAAFTVYLPQTPS
ncbi:sensor histidine kinase [Catelliglobosispora koreensis]|uniref:sensor histidine kinase n=1 Tax=Catelliglobosispora koreensis TaxID=129052 RepID=UPI000371E00B|nr:HAMP domain-containing sensor histidine kinase [Catelliglobosispora koreensis]